MAKKISRSRGETATDLVVRALWRELERCGVGRKDFDDLAEELLLGMLERGEIE